MGAKLTKEEKASIISQYKSGDKEGAIAAVKATGKTSTPATSSSSSVNTGTSGGVSGNNTGGGDVYGDVSKNSTATGPMDFSNYTGDKTLSNENALFGKDAIAKQNTDSNFLTNRNNTIAYELQTKKNNGETIDVNKYLSQFDSFKNASDEDKANTIRAINDRLSAMDKGSTTITTETDNNGLKEKVETEETTETTSKDGYYFDKSTGQYTKIYGYDDLSKEYRDLIDRMDEQERKYLSNMWAAGMQKQVKTYLDAMRQKEDLDEMQDKNKEIYDINRAKSLIEAEQTLRHSQEQYDNLKQNWEYLGNMGMPGTSATKIQAIGDALKEAHTTLGEIQQLTKLKLDAQQKQWEAQVLQYNQQIDNLMYNLNWQVGSEVQAALSKFTTAELEGQLDTIDGITAFRKELLDDLDANISGLTAASLDQMQYITQQYQDIADKMYDYQQNAQKVNTEMSAVKGYYVDGNGNPIFNAKGETIQVPQSAPLDPVFDKETGKLIVFGYDENGNIVANVQQVWDNGDLPAQMQYGIVSLLEMGYDVGDILKAYPNADLKTVQDLAKVVKQKYGYDGKTLQWSGDNYTPVSREDAQGVVLGLQNSGKGGWCGAYVNQYLQKLGFGPSFIKDSLDSKLNIINTEEGYRPQVGDVVVFDYNHITPETGENNGHVGIVRGFRNGKMVVLDSNFKSDREIREREVDFDDKAIQGYFNPTKSIEEYNQGRAGMSKTDTGTALQGYNPSYTADYTTYLKSGINGFTKATQSQLEGIFGSMDNFIANANAYKNEIDHQVGEVAMTMVDNMVDVIEWLQSESGSMNSLRFPLPGTKEHAIKGKFNQIMKSSALQKLIDLKGDGATFGALSDNELGFITDAADWFNIWDDKDTIIEGMEEKIKKILEKSHMTLDEYQQRKGGSTSGLATNTTTEDITSYARNQW